MRFDLILRVSTLLGILAVVIKVFFAKDQPIVLFPDYSDVVREIENKLEHKLDSLDASIVEVKISIDKSKGKEKIIINNREALINEKNNAVRILGNSIPGSAVFDSVRNDLIKD